MGEEEVKPEPEPIDDAAHIDFVPIPRLAPLIELGEN